MGGVHRYLQDEFYGGGQWPVLAGAYPAIDIEETARRAALDWIEDQADSQGHLPEQSTARLLNPDYHQPWLQRWGPIASPLLWSHAMYLIALRK